MNTEHGHGLNQADPRTHTKAMMEGTKAYSDSSVDPGHGVVKVPKIYWEFTTKGILTMEWIDGIKLTDRDALLSAKLDIQQLVDQVLPPLYNGICLQEVTVQYFSIFAVFCPIISQSNLHVVVWLLQGVLSSLRQLLEEGYFHADPHPGNVVVTREGVLAYFDFGMMSEFRWEYRIGLIRTVCFITISVWNTV
jgi:aarF domain-containing kinase